MKKYIDAETFKTLFTCDRETLEAEFERYAKKYDLDEAGKAGARFIFFGTVDLINESVDACPAADVIEMPFQTDGIAAIYSDTIKVTNVEALAGETLKAVLFHVTQEESDRYDAEAERIIAGGRTW